MRYAHLAPLWIAALIFHCPLVGLTGVHRDGALTGASTMTMDRLLVSRKQLREIGVCLSFAHIDRLEKRGKFPRRIKLGTHRESRVVWRYPEVLGWIEERAKETPPLINDEVS